MPRHWARQLPARLRWHLLHALRAPEVAAAQTQLPTRSPRLLRGQKGQRLHSLRKCPQMPPAGGGCANSWDRKAQGGEALVPQPSLALGKLAPALWPPLSWSARRTPGPSHPCLLPEACLSLRRPGSRVPGPRPHLNRQQGRAQLCGPARPGTRCCPALPPLPSRSPPQQPQDICTSPTLTKEGRSWRHRPGVVSAHAGISRDGSKARCPRTPSWAPPGWPEERTSPGRVRLVLKPGQVGRPLSPGHCPGLSGVQWHPGSGALERARELRCLAHLSPTTGEEGALGDRSGDLSHMRTRN